MGIVCAAVVGQQNNPLYIKILSPVDDEVKFHYMVHASLDAVEEKVGGQVAPRLACPLRTSRLALVRVIHAVVLASQLAVSAD